MTKFIAYLPACFPDYTTSIQAFKTLVDSGVDVIEIGLPYSDPVMDGETIQRASKRAIDNGFHIDALLRIVEEVLQYSRTKRAVLGLDDVEIYVMSYYNPVFKYGQAEFAEKLAKAGAKGVIIPDLTPDMASEWLNISKIYNLNTVFLTAINSSAERIELIVRNASGFIYASSLLGTTGERNQITNLWDIRENISRIEAAKQLTGLKTPIYVGLGISTPDQARQIAGVADGVIVGSRLVKALENGIDELAVTAGELVQAVKFMNNL